MMDDDDLLASLPGSERMGGEKREVSNYTLMPLSDPLKFTASKQGAGQDPSQLGSGGKIPESYDSRMLSQFSMPDPQLYDPRRRKSEATRAQQTQSWWTDPARQSSVSCAPYKSDTSSSGKGGKEKPVDEKAVAAKVKEEKFQAKKRENALFVQKEHLLKGYCTGGTASPGSAEAYRVMGQVAEINKQLGLPPGHFGEWKVPV